MEGVNSSEQVKQKVDQMGMAVEAAAMYLWYTSAKAAGDVVYTVRAAQVLSSAAKTADLAASLSPATVSAFTTSSAPAAATSLAPALVSMGAGLSAGAGTAALLTGAGVTTVSILTAPALVPIAAAATVFGVVTWGVGKLFGR